MIGGNAVQDGTAAGYFAGFLFCGDLGGLFFFGSVFTGRNDFHRFRSNVKPCDCGVFRLMSSYISVFAVEGLPRRAAMSARMYFA